MPPLQGVLHNKVQVINLSGGSASPEWSNKRKKSVAAGFELIQDFGFPTYAQSIFLSENGSYIFITGGYPPRVRCYDVNIVSMKFEFNADMVIMGGLPLSPDYRKFALRGEGRQVTIHNNSVIIERLKMPHLQRALEYHRNTCDLLSVGFSKDLHRFSLDTGAFLEPFVTGSVAGNNACSVFPEHGLVLVGGANGVVEAWDPRAPAAAGATNVGCTNVSDASRYAGALTLEQTPSAGEGCEVTSLACEHKGGLLFVAGTSTGQVVLYDLRLSRPLHVKDHMTTLPIVQTYFYKSQDSSANYVLSGDTGAVRIWDTSNGTNFTTLEAPSKLHDFAVLKAQHNLAPPYTTNDSGIICMCCDMPKVQMHFVPALGVAPRWASNLERIAEEGTGDEAKVVYEDYKFITKEQMEGLGITASDVTGGAVRPYMHGALIQTRLYNDLVAVLRPKGHFAEAAAARERKARKTEHRISHFKRAETLPSADGPVDERFAARLKDPAFAVEGKQAEYSALLALSERHKAREAARQRKYDDSQFRVVPRETTEEPEPEDEYTSEFGTTNLHRLKRERDDGVIFEEAKSGASFTATGKLGHELRKRERAKKLTLAERIAKSKVGQVKAI